MYTELRVQNSLFMDRRRFFLVMGLVVLLVYGVTVHGAIADPKYTIQITGSSSVDEGHWTLSIDPASAVNELPLDTDHTVTVTIQHKNAGPCPEKWVILTTTNSTFDNGETEYRAKLNESCIAMATVRSLVPAYAVITASTETSVRSATAEKTWIGIPPNPAFNLSVLPSPLVENGTPVVIQSQVLNDGDVSLANVTVQVNGTVSAYESGDLDTDNQLDPGEIWSFRTVLDVPWTPENTTTLSVNATASFNSFVLTRESVIRYASLEIAKYIANPIVADRFREEYLNVSAVRDGDEMVYGPVNFSILDPAEILVREGSWTFVEPEHDTDEGPLRPVEYQKTWSTGDTTVITFENRLIPDAREVQAITLTEHEASNNLSAGEYDHTFVARVTDQYEEPYENLPINFATDLIESGHVNVTVYSDAAGYASAVFSSQTPQTAVIEAFYDWNWTGFNESEVGDSCTKTWYYIPEITELEVNGSAEAFNNLDEGAYDHTFEVTVKDQYDAGMSGINVTYTVDYQEQDERDEGATDLTSDENGTVFIPLQSYIPDQATVHVSVAGLEAVLNKTWYYQDTEVTIQKNATDLNGGHLVIGDTIQYILTVNATGSSPGREVWVTDLLPEHLTCANVNGDAAGCEKLTWEMENLEAGTPVTWTINATIDEDAAGQSIVNVGTVSGTNFPPEATPGICPDGTQAENGLCPTPVGKTTVFLTKSAEDLNGGVLLVGDTIRYTLTVNNTGDQTAYAVVVTDDLPPYLTCLDVNGYSEHCFDPLSWTVVSLGPGLSVTWTINLTIDGDAAGQSIVNVGTVSGENVPSGETGGVCPDGSEPSGGVCDLVPVRGTVVGLTKTAEDVNGGDLMVGDVIRYTLTVSNLGEEEAYHLVVTDALPSGVTCQDVNGDSAGCEGLSWELDSLTPGASVTWTLNVTIDSGTVGRSIVNVGSVSGTNFPPVDSLKVCPDGSEADESGNCASTPHTQPGEPASQPSSKGGSSGMHSYTSPVHPTPNVNVTEVKEEGGAGRGVQNQTANITEEIPPVGPSGNLLTGLILFILSNLWLFFLLLALIALLLMLWWRRKEEEETPSGPGDRMPGGEFSLPAEGVFAAIIGILNDIDGQLRDLETVVRTSGPLTSRQASAIADRFFVAAQRVEAQIKDPGMKSHLSSDQIQMLNAQLQAAVNRMGALSRQSEPLLNAIQARYAESTA